MRDQGVVTMWTALMLLFLVGLIGLGVDTGYVLLGAHRLQNAADAAALAGALQVRTDQGAARAAAVNCAMANTAAGSPVSLSANGVNAPGGDIVIGRYDRTTGVFNPTVDSPNAVRVTARRSADSPAGHVSLIFGGMFGVDGVDLDREAIAMMGGSVAAGIIVLDPDASRAMKVNGNPTVWVANGVVHVNSDDDIAIQACGHPYIVATAIHVVGGGDMGGADFDGEFLTGVAFADDPLADLPTVDYAGMIDHGGVTTKKGSTTLDPGYYSGGIHGSGGEVFLNPGVYVLGGAGLDFSGKADLTAEGVMLYIVDPGSIDLTGKGAIRITPPDPEVHAFIGATIYAGISLFQERSNSNDAKITGKGDMVLSGTLYIPGADMKIAGNGDTFGSQLIVNTIKVSGNGVIHVDYDGRFPLAGHRVFLVE